MEQVFFLSLFDKKTAFFRVVERRKLNEMKSNNVPGKSFMLSSLFNKQQQPVKLPPKSKPPEPNKFGKSEDNSLRKEDLDAVKDTYDLIIELMKDSNPDIEKSMLEQYDAHVRSINLDLSMKLKHGTPPHIVNTHINNAKYNLFEICMKKFLEYLSNVDGRLLNVLGRINEAHNAIIKNLTSRYIYLNDEIKRILDNIQVADGGTNKIHESSTKSLSPHSKMNKEKEQQSSLFSEKKLEKKTSLLPSS